MRPHGFPPQPCGKSACMAEPYMGPVLAKLGETAGCTGVLDPEPTCRDR
ncbi:hypothetical protein GA0070624_3915 [Micromonospora rhizosphaerae]|uniref:Uncharacterized protein n=1 Tax=Micromonospora rhizosphaerae TaxID=568872 RepID=A0A1C6SJD6_9ACTN|nr:hypothetical protein GA0070624_3915 [Micromonospora rhizosphaerae]